MTINPSGAHDDVQAVVFFLSSSVHPKKARRGTFGHPRKLVLRCWWRLFFVNVACWFFPCVGLFSWVFDMVCLFCSWLVLLFDVLSATLDMF